MYRKRMQGWFKHLDFIVLDLLCVLISFVLAYIMRHGLRNPFQSYLYRSMAIVLILIATLADIFFNMYKNVLKRGYYTECIVAVKQSVLLVLFTSFYLVLVQDAQLFSRFVLYMMGILYLLIGYFSRCLWKQMIKRKKGFRAETLLLITTSEILEQTVSSLETNYYRPYRLIGAAVIDRDLKGETLGTLQVLANRDDVVDYVCREWVDEVFINLPKEESDTADELLQCFARMGVVVHTVLAQADELNARRQSLQKMGTYLVLTAGINYFTPWQAFVKRFLDILGGLAGCIVTVILFLFLAPVIYIHSPGPIFFSQKRMGRNGKEFKMYKFRSMYIDAEKRKHDLMEQNRHKDGMMFKLDFDPRIIGNKTLSDGTAKEGVGAFIRRHSLDEFPQFFNCLCGSMSLVGTRPPTIDEWKKYELHHRARLAIKPGLTGLWQVSGRSEITDFEEVVRLDREYIDNWSLRMDVKILLKTVKVMIMGKETM